MAFLWSTYLLYCDVCDKTPKKIIRVRDLITPPHNNDTTINTKESYWLSQGAHANDVKKHDWLPLIMWRLPSQVCVLASLLHFGPRPPSASFPLPQPVCHQLPTHVGDQQRLFTAPALLLVQQKHFVWFYGGIVSFRIFWLTAEFMTPSITAG